MESFLVFAVIGLLAGGSARLLFPGRRPTRVLGTMLIGMIGAVIGGAMSWGLWPAVDGEFHSGNLLLSVLGAAIVIALWSGVAYVRGLSGPRTMST